jgi:RimJ/RimL family protein N-acetyltransferase
MGEKMNIREAKVEDWEQLRGLLIRLTSEEPPVAIELEPLIMKGSNWLAEFPRGKSGFFSVAVDDGKIIGFCYLAVPKFYNPVAYIGIALDKEHRRKDIGTEMFYHVAGWASAENLMYIIADVWSWNKNSIKFFKSLEFKEKQKFTDKFKGRLKEKARLVKKL